MKGNNNINKKYLRDPATTRTISNNNSSLYWENLILDFVVNYRGDVICLAFYPFIMVDSLTGVKPVCNDVKKNSWYRAI